MQNKYSTETLARTAALKQGNTRVTIINSNGSFYLETEPAIIRTWESVTYEGRGKDALKNWKP